MKKSNLLVLIIVAMVTLSCTPKSAQTTKAVVISKTTNDKDKDGSWATQVLYKVEYITYGVVGHTWTAPGFTKGDTILVHDPYRGRVIQ